MLNITSGTMLTAAFENSSLLSDLPTAKLFYYEPPNISGTVNFGYGINLSLAAQDPTAKLIVSGILSDNGVQFTSAQWAALATRGQLGVGKTDPTIGQTTANQLSAAYAALGNAPAVAASITADYMAAIVVPALRQKISNFDELPVGVQWALEDTYYQSPANLQTSNGASQIYIDARSGSQWLVAEQLAFNTGRTPSSGQAAATGTILRNFARAVLALGGSVTLDGNNQVTSVDFSGANIVASNSPVAPFLSDILGQAAIGFAGDTPQQYVNAFGSAAIQTSFNNLVSSLQSSLNAQGIAVVAAGNTFATLAGMSTAQGITPTDVALLNGYAPGSALAAGQVLSLPTARVQGAPATLSSAFDYVYDVATGHTVSSPNSEGAGGLTIRDSATGAYLGYFDTNNPILNMTVSAGSLTVSLSGNRSITFQSGDTIVANDGKGDITPYAPGASLSVSSDGNTSIKEGASSSWQNLFSPAPDPYLSPIGGGVSTSSIDNAQYLANLLSQLSNNIDPTKLTQSTSFLSTDDQGNEFLTGVFSGQINGQTVTVRIDAPLTSGVSGTVTITRVSDGLGIVETHVVQANGDLGPPQYQPYGSNTNFDIPGTTFTQSAAADSDLETTLNNRVGLDTPSGTPNAADIGLIGTISVVNLGTNPDGNLPLLSDPTGTAANGLVVGTSDLALTMPNVNLTGVFNNSPAEIATGGYEPGNQITVSIDDSLTSQLLGTSSAGPSFTAPLPDGSLADISTASNTFHDIDPLVLDLNGDGISLSNWIANNVYFQSNVTFNATTGQAVSDGKLHHTSWVNATDGILALPVNSQITDITQTLSEYFEGGQYNASTGKYTPWTDGVAALASLAQPGATSFSAATSLTDAKT
jgi:hypothetical protein